MVGKNNQGERKQMKPLYMWAGGKNKMLKHYTPHLPAQFKSYVEPFLGGGAMFIWAYENNPACETFHLNDLNDGLINIYHAIKTDFPTFIDHLNHHDQTYIALDGPDKIPTNKALEKEHDLGSRRKDWKKIFAKQPSRRHYYFRERDAHAFEYKSMSKTQEAALLYFLMKTGFNGVWQENASLDNRFGTPCGLLNQKDTTYDLDNLTAWHNALQKCKMTSGDFKKTMTSVGKESFVFLDPPYRGCFTNYGTQSDDSFQEETIKYFNDSKQRGAYAMLCNRDIGDSFFEDRKGTNTINRFDVKYTVGRKKKSDSEVGGFEEAKKAVEVLLT